MDVVDQIDIEKIISQAEKPEGVMGSALPGVMRELIRTPGFKELLLIHLRGASPENARELVKTALWEDVAFSMSVIGASPNLINCLAEALVELGLQLNNFTAEILKDFLAQLGKDLDTETLKSIPGAYAPLVNDLLLEDREALDGLIAGLGSLAEDMMAAGERTWRKIWSTADFGKIRVSITDHLEQRMAELEDEPEIFNPIPIANLFGIVPPLTNFLLRVFTRVLQALNLPAEILANALFQLLEDIDKRELGGLVNALANVVLALHRGNLVLGRDEPRFKAVFERLTRDVIDNVDGEQFKQMLIALKEDGAVVGGVIADYVFASPEATVQAVKALYLGIAAALRTVAETYHRLSELPPHALGEIIDAYEEALDVGELGRIASQHAALFNKSCEARPDWVAGSVSKILASLDNDELAQTGRVVARQVKDAVLADPSINAALEPEMVGERINQALAYFNRFSWENPKLMADKVSRTLAVLDVDQLVLAIGEVLSVTVSVLVKNPAFVSKLLRPLAKPAAIAGAVGVGSLVGGVLVIRRLRK